MRLLCMFYSFRCYFSLGLDFSGFLLLIGLPFFFAFLWVQVSSLIYLDFWQLGLYLCWGFPCRFPAWFLADLWSILYVYFLVRTYIFSCIRAFLATSLQFRMVYLIFRTLSRFSFGNSNSRWRYHFAVLYSKSSSFGWVVLALANVLLLSNAHHPLWVPPWGVGPHIFGIKSGHPLWVPPWGVGPHIFGIKSGHPTLEHVRAFPAFWDSSNFSKHQNFGPHIFTQWFKTLWIKW